MVWLNYKKLHLLCVCAKVQFKDVPEKKYILSEKNVEVVFLKIREFHYYSYNIFHYISMIFYCIQYYLNVFILLFYLAKKVSTSEHFHARNVPKTEHFVSTSEHFHANHGGTP
jgi:hypothetical protein